MALVERLPLELKRQIATYLDNAPDLYSVTQSRPRLKSDILGNDTFNKELLENIAPNSLEYLSVDLKEPDWQAALVNVLEREHNLAAGRPVNITSFPIPDDFLYQDHTLLFLRDRTLELYGIHSAAARIFPDLFSGLPEDAQRSKPKLVHYSSGILSVRLEDYGSSNDCRLGIFRITDDEHPHLLLLVNVPPGGSEVVRNDERNAVVGTHTRTGDGWSWRFAWFSLLTSSATRLYEVGNFNASEVGTNIVFEVYDRCFWAISSEVTVDPEGEAPVSYYGGCRVDLSVPGSRAQYFRIWRRDQTDGPIHDSFTRLAFLREEKDEGKYLITESRAEWLRPGKAERSFYTTVFKPEPVEETEPDLTRPLAIEDLAQATHQDNFDCIETLLAAGDESCLTVFTGERHRHLEQGRDSEGNDMAAGIPTYRARQLAHSAFHPLSNTWVDVVWDVTSKFGDQTQALKGEHALRLRIGSRRAGPAYDTFPKEGRVAIDSSELALNTPIKPTDSPTLDLSCPVFWHQPVVLFPAKNAPTEQIRRFEIPGYPSADMFKVFSDSRSIVIGLKDRPSKGHKARFACERNVLVINFDPMAKWGQHRQQQPLQTEHSEGQAIGPPQVLDTLTAAKGAELTAQADSPAGSERSLVVRTSLQLTTLDPAPVLYKSDWEDGDDDEVEEAEEANEPEGSHEMENVTQAEAKADKGKSKSKGKGKGKARRRASTVSNHSDGDAPFQPDSSTITVPTAPSLRTQTTATIAAASAAAGPSSSAGPSHTPVSKKKKRRASNSSVSTVYSISGPFSTYYDADNDGNDADDDNEADNDDNHADKRQRVTATAAPTQSPAQFEQGIQQRDDEFYAPNHKYKNSNSDSDYPCSASEDRHHAEELFPEYNA